MANYSNDDVNDALRDNLDWLLQKLGLTGDYQPLGAGMDWASGDGRWRLHLRSRISWEYGGDGNGTPPKTGDDLLGMVATHKDIPFAAAKSTAVTWLKEIDEDFRPGAGHARNAVYYAAMPVPEDVVARTEQDWGPLTGATFWERLVRKPEHRFAGAWVYRDLLGRVLFVRGRYDHLARTTKKKDYYTAAHFAPQWKVASKKRHLGSFRLLPPDRRYPLYGTHLIAARRPDLVLIVEGEKTADAAQTLLDKAGLRAVALSWPNGAEAVSRCDWAVCRGLRCVIWPDRDKAGLGAVNDLVGELSRIGAADVGIVPVTTLPVSDGWDLADYNPEEHTFDPVVVIGEAGVEPAWQRAARTRYFVVTAMPKRFIFQIEEEHHHGRVGQTLIPRSKDEFRSLENRYIIEANNPLAGRMQSIGRGDALLLNNMLPEYRSVVFDPRGELPENLYYNAYRGLGVEPRPGEPTHFLQFVQDLFGEDRLVEYWLNKLAWKIQNLERPGEVADVLIGAQGAGKTFLMERCADLFGGHCFIAGSSDHVVGDFNGHLQYKMFLGIEEAIHWTDKRAWAKFKPLVTSGEIPYHHKGGAIVMDANRLYIMMLSNDDHVLQARELERRYFAVRVTKSHLQDVRYFGQLRAVWEAGEKGQLLNFLQQRELGEFHPLRDLIRTVELTVQQDLSLEPHEEWWVNTLEEWDSGPVYFMERNGGYVPTKMLYEDYFKYVEKIGPRRPMGVKQFGDWFAKVVPYTLRNAQQRVDGGNKRCWKLPPRVALVTAWDARGGAKVREGSETEVNIKAEDPISNYNKLPI